MERVVVFTALTDMVTLEVFSTEVEREEKRRDSAEEKSRTDRASLDLSGIYQRRGGTPLRYDWLEQRVAEVRQCQERKLHHVTHLQQIKDPRATNVSTVLF